MTQVTFPKSLLCAEGTGMEKGIVVKATDPSTVAASDGANDQVAGILYTEKVAGNGATQCLVMTGPGDELKAVASGSIGLNDPLVTAISATSPSNMLASAVNLTSTQLSGSRILGFSREIATAGETFKYVLDIQSIGRGA